MKKAFNKYFVILLVGFMGWIVETAIFGFNAKPQSGAESVLDVATAGMMIYGIIGDLSRNVRITKSYHTVNNHNVRTKNLHLNSDDQVVHYNTTVKVTPEQYKGIGKQNGTGTNKAN